MNATEKQAREALILLSEAISWARDQEITDRQARAIRRMNDAQDAIRNLLAQRQPEIYIVQDDTGDVIDVFRDRGEATAAYQEGYSVIEETIWEPGEYGRHA